MPDGDQRSWRPCRSSRTSDVGVCRELSPRDSTSSRIHIACCASTIAVLA